MFDDNKGPMMTELNVQYTDIQNKRRAGLVWMVGIGVIILFQIPGGIIGFIMGVSGKAQRACGTVISLIGFMITSVMLMNSDDGFFMSILLYVKSFYVYFIKHEYLYIALNYFPRSIASACVFFMALESGLIFGYYLFSQGHNDITRKESRVRYNRQGQQEKFMDKDQIKRELNKRLRREKKEKEKRPETIIGSTSLGDEIAITDDEARMHTLVCGASGSGKTTTLEHFILSCARRGLPCIFVDGKYDEEFPFKVKAIAEKYSRKFYHFDINGEMSKTKWNPLKNGTNSNLKDKLIDLTDWSEPHYKVNAERALMLILDVVTKIEEETKEMNEDEKKAYFTFEKKEDEKEDKKGKNKKKAKQNTPPEAEQQKKIIDTRINVFEDSKNDSNKSQKEKKTLEGFVVEKSLISIYQLLVPSRLSDAISCVKSEEAKKDFVDRQRRLNADWYAGLESRVALLAETAILKELLSEDKSGIDLRRVLE
ncbi:MAG TPA: FtsK/SpoIIIE domain-containing protein, partial [Methanobacterium sp.]|nr:FtsK/SpoIIIE domain-containing protein [Methanobacterium sp.]